MKKNTKNKYQELLSLLHKNEDSTMFLILNEAEFDVNSTDSKGRTLLHYAVIENNFNIAKLLLDKGANSSHSDNNGWTPLHYAAQNYNAKLSELLIKYGADVNAKDEFGNTVIARATFASQGDGEVILLLLKNGADPKITNNRNVSAIDLAYKIGNFDVTQYFK